jgi:hypothetical protein
MTANPLDDVRLSDSSGEMVRLGDVWKDELVVLVWLRHYG